MKYSIPVEAPQSSDRSHPGAVLGVADSVTREAGQALERAVRSRDQYFSRRAKFGFARLEGWPCALYSRA
jgi:hypothetical protein